MAGGTARLLHQIFQRTGMTPDEVMEKPRFTRVFLLQSTRIQIEEEAAQAQRDRDAQRNNRQQTVRTRSRRR